MRTTCSNCGKKIERKPRQIKRSKTGRFFCSVGCQNSKSSRKKGYKTGPIKGTKHKKGCGCPWCIGIGCRGHKKECNCSFCGSHPPKNTKPLVELLINGGPRAPSKGLKRRLLKEGLLENRCYLCGLAPEWNGSILVLQLDHINGLSWDWRIKNLRILCPNCHTQTSTYSNKKRV